MYTRPITTQFFYKGCQGSLPGQYLARDAWRCPVQRVQIGMSTSWQSAPVSTEHRQLMNHTGVLTWLAGVLAG